jgi:hypothetical protein
MAVHDYNLADALRLLRNPACTRMAGLLATAQRLRGPQRPVVDGHEMNSHGYTLAQSVAGGYQNAMRSNRKALATHAAAALAVLLEKDLLQTALHLVELLERYRVDVSPLRHQVKAYVRRIALEPQLAAAKAAFAEAEKAYGDRWEQLADRLPHVPVHMMASDAARLQAAHNRLLDVQAQMSA